MFGYDSQSHSMSLSSAATIDPTDGIKLVPGITQSVNAITVTDSRAVSVQVWFKGSVQDGTRLLSIASYVYGFAYIQRSSNDFVVDSDMGPPFTIAGAYSALDNTNWVLVGLSFGWATIGTDHLICIYISQASTNYEHSECHNGYSVLLTDWNVGTNARI